MEDRRIFRCIRLAMSTLVLSALGLGLTAVRSGAQVSSCATSGGVLHFDGKNYVCSADITTKDGGKSLSINQGDFTSRTQNGWRNATQFLSKGNDGIANAAANGENQSILAEPTYPGREEYLNIPGNLLHNPLANGLPKGTHLHDARYGRQWDLFRDPMPFLPDPSRGIRPGVFTYAQMRTCLMDTPPSPLTPVSERAGPGTANVACDAENNFTVGAGLTLGSPWYTVKGHGWANTYLARGINQSLGMNTIKASTGDSATIYAYHQCLGGITAPSDEGCEPVDIHGGLLWAPLQGSPIASGSGITSIPVQCAANCIYAGDGRYLTITSQASKPFYIDSAPLISGTSTQSIVSNESRFPVSTAFGIVVDAKGYTHGSVGTDPKPATLTVGKLNGTFQTGAPICLAGGYYEVAEVTAVGASSATQTVTAKIRYPVAPGVEVWQGGMCGQGIVFLHGLDWDTVRNSHKWVVWPVAGSPDARTLRVFGNAKGGQNGPQNIYHKADFQAPMRTITRTANEVSGALIRNNGPGDVLTTPLGGLTSMTISQASDPSLNGPIAGMSIAPAASVGLIGPDQFVWRQTGPDIRKEQTATVTVHGIDHAIVLPAMEVVSAQQETERHVVPLVVEYNNNRLSASDTLEEPVHQWFGGTGQVINWNGGYGPLNMGSTPALVLNTTGSIGQSMVINNRNPDSSYAGLGGGATPETALQFGGVYGSIFNIRRGPMKLGGTTGAIIAVGCPARGCNAGGNGYNVESLTGNGGFFLTTWNAKANSYTLNDAGNQWFYTPSLTTALMPLQFSGVKSDPSTLLSGMLWNRSDLGRPRWYNTAAHSLAFQDELPLPGTTASIGGSSITAGSCATGAATVSGAAVGTPVAVSASDGSLPNPLIILSAAVTATNTVTVQLCAVATVTPAAKTYKVGVIR